MTTRSLLTTGLYILATLLLCVSAWAVPGRMSYQGHLTSQGGNELNGTFQMHFELFNDLNYGNLLWQEDQSVEVLNGNYNVHLGSVTSLDETVFEGDQVYLQVSVFHNATSSWETFAPRLSITSSAYAFRTTNADMLEGCTSSDFASATHTHSASDVNEGYLSPSVYSAKADLLDEGLLDNGPYGIAQNNRELQAYLNADFLDGKHANDFAPTAHIHDGGDITGGKVADGFIDDGITRDAEVISIVKANDGTGSGVDADLLDGLHSGSFASDIHYHNILNAADGSPAQALYVDSDGEVGLGLTNPRKKMHLSESVSGTSFALKLDNSARESSTGILFSAGGDWGKIAPDRGKGALVYEDVSTWNRGKFHFLQKTNSDASNPNINDSVMTIENDGDVCIGQKNAGNRLHIIDTRDNITFPLKVDNHRWYPLENIGAGILFSIGGDNGFFAPNRGKGALIYEGRGNYNRGSFHFLQDSDSNQDVPDMNDSVMTISNNGNVGIATTSPVTKLEVASLARISDVSWPSSGEGLELAYDADLNKGYIQAYDRDRSQWGEVFIGGRVVTPVLEITGGSDLSEKFNIQAHDDEITPGMVVSIAPQKPGMLQISNEAYDKKVAGIVSGAGGVNPGMLMAQKDSAADGTTPIALTGRAYCLADASEGSIEPGDLLTTSNTPGHAMKVRDYGKAQGAILGKAMTSLARSKGLVLVLVTLQ